MFRHYYSLIKPGIVWSNALTAVAGFFLASNGHVNWLLGTETVFGISLVVASACVVNNYIDRDIDALMKRTKKRALVQGVISLRHALLFAFVLFLLGVALLFFYTNWLTLLVALFGFGVYTVLYSIAKRRTIYAVHVGGFAGAVPPIVGYTAVTHTLDIGALFLFLILFFWQLPHSFAIGLYRKDDYNAAHIPVFPTQKNKLRTHIEMSLYILLCTAAALGLTRTGLVNYWYSIIVGSACLAWLVLSIEGFFVANEHRWARQMFFCSLVVMLLFCLSIIAL